MARGLDFECVARMGLSRVTVIPTVPGAAAVVEWFGEWPSFHDAEITSVCVDRSGRSFVRIHAWIRTNQTGENGGFIIERETAVVFECSEISWLHLEGENADTQNVISGLMFEQVSEGHRLILGPCYGLSGEIVARRWSLRLETLTDDEKIQRNPHTPKKS